MINDISQTIIDYQKDNFIVKKCVENSQFLYSYIKANYKSNAKVKACILLIFDKSNSSVRINKGHLIIEVEDNIFIDPSYDISKNEYVNYYYTIREFFDYLKKENMNIMDIGHTKVNDLIDTFLYFVRYANNVNNGIFCINDMEYYTNLKDCIMNKYPNILSVEYK